MCLAELCTGSLEQASCRWSTAVASTSRCQTDWPVSGHVTGEGRLSEAWSSAGIWSNECRPQRTDGVYSLNRVDQVQGLEWLYTAGAVHSVGSVRCTLTCTSTRSIFHVAAHTSRRRSCTLLITVVYASVWCQTIQRCEIKNKSSEFKLVSGLTSCWHNKGSTWENLYGAILTA